MFDDRVLTYFYQVWDKIAPAMASQFDAPYSVPLIAPRPLLLNGKTNHISY